MAVMKPESVILRSALLLIASVPLSNDEIVVELEDERRLAALDCLSHQHCLFCNYAN
jgi:hypothetical protein